MMAFYSAVMFVLFTVLSHAATNTVVILGSSVAKGFAGGGAITNGSYLNGYAGLLTPVLESKGWIVTNASVGGDSTGDVLARFDSDVVPLAPNYVLIALSMANEGLVTSSDLGSTMEVFRSGLTSIIQRCRSNGYYPVAGLNYPNGLFAAIDYDYIKQVNLLINAMDLPSVNFLGAVDNGAGQWEDGFWNRGDDYHPNALGHKEFFYAFVPSLFNAISAGKTNLPQLAGTTGFVRVPASAEKSPMRFAPDAVMHGFTTTFRFRSIATGTIAAVHSAYPKPAIFVDFGPNQDSAGRATTNPDSNGNYWNSWRPTAVGATINTGTVTNNLISANGQTSTIGILITNRFDGAYGGPTAGFGGGLMAPNGPETSLLGNLAIETATEDYFFATNGTMIITGLNAGSSYDIQLFGSRDSGDTRETRYTVVGGNGTFTNDVVTTGYGIAVDGIYSGNNEATAYFSDVTPNGNGEIVVRVAALQGLFGYLNVMKISENVSVPLFEKVLVDFGRHDGVNGNATVNPDVNGNYWNNFSSRSDSAVTSGTKVLNMITTGNGATSIGLQITNAGWTANGILNGGLTNPSASRLGHFAIPTATQDYFFTPTNATFKLTGLDTGSVYSLSFFGSRLDTVNRLTTYSVGTNAVDLLVGGSTSGISLTNRNDHMIVSLNNLIPSALGEIVVTVSNKSGSNAHLNVLEIARAIPTNQYGTLEIRTNALVYVSPDGPQISSAIAATDGSWHEVAVSHRYADGKTQLFIDGVLAGTVAERLVPNLFVLGGPAFASDRPDAPSQADFQDWCVFRSAWTADEALAHHQGRLQQASMEICAPLNDSVFLKGVPATNKAQSLSFVLIQATNLATGTVVTPPGNLQPVSYSDTSVQLTWLDNSVTETGYVVERRIAGVDASWSTIATLAAGSTSYTNTGVTQGVVYEYRVSSQEGTLQSEYSSVVSISPGNNGQSYREWISGYLPISLSTYVVDFNTGSGINYGGVVWNTITSLTAGTAFTLASTNNDRSNGYQLTITDSFDQFRGGNGNPLAGYDDDPQSTLFASTAPWPGKGQITLSGLNTNLSYDVTLFSRRSPIFAGYDYRSRYVLKRAGEDVSFELNVASNTRAIQVYGVRPDSSRSIVLDVEAGDNPTGLVFASINMMAVTEVASSGFLIDFNTNTVRTYPSGEAWNTVTNFANSTYNLVDSQGGGSSGFKLVMNNNLDGHREGTDLPGGFSSDAESTLFFVQGASSQMTFSGLRTNRTYNFVFLARRDPAFAGFDYSGVYVFAGSGTPVTSIVDAVSNTAFTSVMGISPTSSSNITLTISTNAAGVAGVDFPVLNLIRMTENPGPFDATLANASADADNDGIANSVEYAYNQSPVVAGTNGFAVHQPGRENASATFSAVYSTYLPAKNASYFLVSTTNLLAPNWQVDGGITQTIQSVVGSNSTFKMTRTMNDAFRFIRLGIVVAGVTNYTVPVGYQRLTIGERRSFVSPSLIPTSATLAGILGTDQLPDNTTESTATTVDIWDQAQQTLTNRYWLSSNVGFDGWRVAPAFDPADSQSIDIEKGMIITVRSGEGTQLPKVVGTVPSSSMSQSVKSNGYTLAGAPFPVAMTLAQSGILASGFVGGDSLVTSDNLLFFNTTSQNFDEKIWYDTGSAVWRNADASLATRTIQPGESFLIRRRSRGTDMNWISPLPYTLP